MKVLSPISFVWDQTFLFGILVSLTDGPKGSEHSKHKNWTVVLRAVNRSFPSCSKPLFQSEAKSKAIKTFL